MMKRELKMEEFEMVTGGEYTMATDYSPLGRVIGNSEMDKGLRKAWDNFLEEMGNVIDKLFD